MSTTLSAMTAAELAAELRRLADVKAGAAMYAEYPRTSNDPRWAEKVLSCDVSIAAITAELDARCEHWGFELTRTEQGNIWSIGKTLIGDRGNHYQCNVFAEQFHALLGYLLTKGGAK